MPELNFLSALPALLGLAGFVLFQALGANRSGDAITGRIIGKLRGRFASELPADHRLTPRQLARLLEGQQRLREAAGEYDYRLLKQALLQQFLVTILVYSLTVGFCGWSAYLFAGGSGKEKKPVSGADGQEQSAKVSTGNCSPNVDARDKSTVVIQYSGKAAPCQSGGSGTGEKK